MISWSVEPLSVCSCGGVVLLTIGLPAILSRRDLLAAALERIRDCYTRWRALVASDGTPSLAALWAAGAVPQWLAS